MAAQPVDYDALAKQAGAITPGAPAQPDYDALAKQAGAISQSGLATPSAGTPTYSATATAPAPQGSALGRFASNFLKAINPFPALKHYLYDVPQQDAQKIQQDLQTGDYFGALGHIVQGATPGGHFLPDTLASQAHQFVQAYKDLQDTQGMPRLPERLASAEGHALAGALPLVGPAAANAGGQIGSGDVAGGLGSGAGLVASVLTPEAAKAAAPVAAKVAEADIPGRAGAFVARPSTLENFSDAFAAVPTQRPVLTQAMDTFQRMGISPAKNIQEMSGEVEQARAKLSGVYDTLIPFVENRQIPAADVIDGLEQQKAAYTRKGVVSESNKPFVAKIDQEIGTVQQLSAKNAAENGTGNLDFNDVRYLRDGMNGRTDFKSPQAEEDFFRSVGDVYRDALDEMAPETTGINRDWANLENAKFIADKNMAMGRGVVPSGLQKLLPPKMTTARALSALAGGLYAGPAGLTAALLPDIATGGLRFAKSLPDRIRAAKNYTPPVEYPNPAAEVPPAPAGLLAPANVVRDEKGNIVSDNAGYVRMPPGADASGAVPGPGIGAHVSPDIGRGLPALPPPSRVQTGGFATGDDLVPVKDPQTGHYVYVARWTLQHPGTSGTEGAIASEPTSVPESGRGTSAAAHDARGTGPDVRSAQGTSGSGVLASGGPHQSAPGNLPGNAGEVAESGAQRQARERFAEAKTRAGAQILYHGTSKAGAANIRKAGFLLTKGGNNAGLGVSLSPDETLASDYAKGMGSQSRQIGEGEVIRATLASDAKLATPADLTAKIADAEQRGIKYPDSVQAAQQALAAEGYDGVRAENGSELRIWNTDKLTPLPEKNTHQSGAQREAEQRFTQAKAKSRIGQIVKHFLRDESGSMGVPDSIGGAKPFTEVSRDYTGKPKEALEWVRAKAGRFAPGAIPHPEIEGGIGLLHGYKGQGPPEWKRGFGVSHIDVRHKGYLDEAIKVIPSLPVVETITDAKSGRVLGKVLSDGKHHAVISHDWRGNDMPGWLLTSYER